LEEKYDTLSFRSAKIEKQNFRQYVKKTVIFSDYPTLNEELFLPRLLRCLLRQKFKKFETLIIDGYSNDGTRQIVEKYSRKLANTYFYQVSKRNVSFQRNLVPVKPEAVIWFFFDADVQIPPSFLQHIKEQVELDVDYITTYIVPDSDSIYERCS